MCILASAVLPVLMMVSLKANRNKCNMHYLVKTNKLWLSTPAAYRSLTQDLLAVEDCQHAV